MKYSSELYYEAAYRDHPEGIINVAIFCFYRLFPNRIPSEINPNESIVSQPPLDFLRLILSFPASRVLQTSCPSTDVVLVGKSSRAWAYLPFSHPSS